MKKSKKEPGREKAERGARTSCGRRDRSVSWLVPVDALLILLVVVVVSQGSTSLCPELCTTPPSSPPVAVPLAYQYYTRRRPATSRFWSQDTITVDGTEAGAAETKPSSHRAKTEREGGETTEREIVHCRTPFDTSFYIARSINKHTPGAARQINASPLKQRCSRSTPQATLPRTPQPVSLTSRTLPPTPPPSRKAAKYRQPNTQSET